MRVGGFVAAVLSAMAVLAACDAGSDVRHVHITIAETGCRPGSVEAEPGRTLHLQIENESAEIYRITDDDERIEPLTLEPGGSVEAFYPLPQGAGEYSLRCTSPEGAASTITVKAGASTQPMPSTGTPGASGDGGMPGAGQPDGTLAVTLVEYSVTPSEEQIAAGRINVIATNISQSQKHELNVLRLLPDGGFEKLAGAEPIAPQEGGSFIVDLQAGAYRLACLVGIGEAGSTVDHYQQGMWVDITVQ